MRKIIEKRNYIILLIILLLIIWIFFPKKEAYVNSFSFKNKVITYVIYDKIDSDAVSKNINNIYKKFNKYCYDKNNIINKTDGYFNDINGYLISYSTNEVVKYLKSYGIKNYWINVDGDVILGNKKSNNNYSVSIHDPDDNSILKVLYFSNKALSSISYSDKLESLKGDRKDYDMVSVICDDIVESNIISNYLYYLSIDDGKKVLLKNKCDGLWYKDGKIITSSKFSKYFNKKL